MRGRGETAWLDRLRRVSCKMKHGLVEPVAGLSACVLRKGVGLPHLFLFIKTSAFSLFMAALGLRCSPRAFSTCGHQGLPSSCSAWGFHCSGFSCRRAQALGRAGFSSCDSWVLERGLTSWYMGLVALQHVGSSWTRDGTRDPCTGRRILNH